MSNLSNNSNIKKPPSQPPRQQDSGFQAQSMGGGFQAQGMGGGRQKFVENPYNEDGSLKKKESKPKPTGNLEDFKPAPRYYDGGK